ncbi:hypothetical protein A4S06_06855 [Erysipelotrichaceae bacterium MTC7]|nr:hypothetical protein A4S06_06855 [Erysipelotrichaceae bacterium MTC7]
MRNKMKQVFTAMLIAMIMMVGMQVPTHAASFDASATTGTLTINREGATYTAYKVLDYTAGSGIYEYSATTAFEGFFGNTNYGSYTIQSMKDLTSESKRIAFAASLEAYAKATNATGTSFEGGSTAQELPIGYYVVVQTGSASTNAYVQNKPISVAIPSTTNNTDYTYNVVVTPKDAKPTVDKKIVNPEDVTSSNENIGDDVTYKLTASVLSYAPNVIEESIAYYLTDTLSKGLTFKASTVEVFGVKAGQDDTELTTGYTMTTDPNPIVEGTTTTITFNFDYSVIKSYDSVKVLYKATLNKFANIGGKENENDVSLTYTNNPNSGEKHETEKIIVKTYTYGVAIKKVDAENTNTLLPGAKFKVYTDEDCTKQVGSEQETGADGYAYFKGLKAGTYYVKESMAPQGYVLSDVKTKIEIIAADDGSATYKVNNAPSNAVDFSDASTDQKVVLTEVTITNAKGFSLPATGGMGTWIFTIGGLVIMAGAALGFVVYKKKAK